MKYSFSALDNSFYPYELREDYDASGTWPRDGVDVDEAVFSEFTAPAPSGKQRGADNNGYPAWIDIPPLTHEQLIEQSEVEKQSKINAANDHMSSKQWPGKAAIGRLKGDELAQYNRWLDYLDVLEAIDTSKAPNITWPDKPSK